MPPSRIPDLGRKGGGARYSSIAASTALTNTVTETILDSKTLQADELRAGDVVEIIAQGIMTATTSSDTMTAKIKVGSTVLCQSSAPDAVDNDVYFLHTFVTIRTDGPSGTFVAAGLQANGVEGTVTAKPDIVASSAIDTTAALVFSVTGTWSQASASDSCRNDTFVVIVHRPYAFD